MQMHAKSREILKHPWNSQVLRHFGLLQRIGSRDVARAAQLAAALRPAVVAAGGYADVVLDPAVDAVYVALPTALKAAGVPDSELWEFLDFLGFFVFLYFLFLWIFVDVCGCLWIFVNSLIFLGFYVFFIFCFFCFFYV